jgi:hypothetical protein
MEKEPDRKPHHGTPSPTLNSTRPLLFGTEPLPPAYNRHVAWLTSLRFAAPAPWPFTGGKLTDAWVEWIVDAGSSLAAPAAEEADDDPVALDPRLVVPVAQCRRLQGLCVAAEAACEREETSWVDHSFLVDIETYARVSDTTHCVPGLVFAILSSKLERFLGDILAFLHAERDAFPRVSACLSVTGAPVPRMLKNLLVHPCLPAVLGSATVVLLQLLLGPPTLLNLRNLLWHGFVDLKQFPRAYVTGLRVLCAWVADRWNVFVQGAAAEAVLPHFYRRPPLSSLRVASLLSCVWPSEQAAAPGSRSAEPPRACSPRLSPSAPPDWMLAWLLIDLEHALRVAWVEYERR